MSLLDIFKKKNTDSEPESSQNTLEQDIKASCEGLSEHLTLPDTKLTTAIVMNVKNLKRRNWISLQNG